MNRRKLAVLGSAVLMVASVLGVSGVAGPAASAADAPCVITFTPNPATAGEPVSISVTGFDPSENVLIERVIDGVPGSSNTVAANSSGDYIAGDLAPSDHSVYVFTFTGQSSSISCTATFTVLPATTTTTADVTTTVDPSTTAPAAEAAAVAATPAFTG